MITKIQRQRIAKAANYHCGYCLLHEVVSGIPLTIEHILPKALGGTDKDENLWLSCRSCNEHKGMLTEAIDPDTGVLVPLFNPRTQNWNLHFVWRENGIWISGNTAIGRATVEALALNDGLRVRARAIWVRWGLHPPDYSHNQFSQG